MSAIGFVGVGAMGQAMVMRLLAAGHHVYVHNRTRRNAAEVEQAGARWCDDPAEVAAATTTVLSCLRDTDAIEAVYLGAAGLVGAVRPGTILVEHGTFAPAMARRVAAAARARHATFLDVPVTGGPAGVRERRLTAMAGGSENALQTVRPVLDSYCQAVIHVGTNGSGLQLKLVNQLLVSAHMASAAEAVAQLRWLDVDLDVGQSVLSRGWGSSAMLDRAFDHVRRGADEGTGVAISGMIEVQQLVAESLEGVQAAVFDASRQIFLDAVDKSMADKDPAALHTVLLPDTSGSRRG